MLFLEDNRARFTKAGGSVAEVGKQAGQEWGSLKPAAKAKYEEQYAAAKATYEKELQAFYAAGGVRAPRRSKKGKEVKKVEKVEDPNKPKLPKRPSTPYMHWLLDNRQEIANSLPAHFKPTHVIVEAGKKWAKVTKKVKGPYEKAFAQDLERYRAEMEEYRAKMKEYKPLEEPKRPKNGYMLFLEDNWARFEKAGGGVTEVMKQAGQEWRSLKPAAKAKYEEQSAAARATYEKELQAFEAAGGVRAPRRSKKGKRAKRVKDPNEPKRPLVAFFRWLKDNRQEIVNSLPADHRLVDVTKEAGKQWAKLTREVKGTYEKAYAQDLERYRAEMEEYRQE